ncbi:MAG: hypothetical protein CME63_18035 [Halobacteriovoraceae bacterium]|nr:hypothetical protein [Halobacteriovoraceae bacterium]|tara:strand:+ start:1855 stop:2991 length:1137 start_codon:yes stop_codon:yes gene_type:complete
MENTLKMLSSVINPATGKSMSEEDRWINAEADEKGQLTVTYQREGISPEQKRKIEEDIISALKGSYDEDKILVKTVSEKKSTQTAPNNSQEKPTSAHANLKVGHGVQGNKKRIPNVKKVIAVSSCKGGVGKSTVSVNLALSLQKLGNKVGILDADIYGPSMPLLLNKKGAKPQATEDKKIRPLDAYGMSFISFGLFINEEDPVIWRGPMLGGVLNQFFFDTDWGELDYLIVDLPPGTGDTQLSLVQNTEVDGVVVVSTPQDVAIADTIKGLKMFQQVNIPIIGMVENMSYFAPEDSDKTYYIFGKDGVKNAASSQDVKFLGGVPLEMGMRESSDEGHPYMANDKNKTKAGWNSYMEIAENVVKIVGTEKKGIFKKLFK